MIVCKKTMINDKFSEDTLEHSRNVSNINELKIKTENLKLLFAKA